MVESCLMGIRQSSLAQARAVIDPRPLFRVAVFGFADRLQRLAEIVLRHTRHNRYRYVLAEHRGFGDFEIALIDMTVREGPLIASTLGRLPRSGAVVKVGRRDDDLRGRDDLLKSAFTMHLVGTLNRFVDENRVPGIDPGQARSALERTAGAALHGPVVSKKERPRVLIVDDSAAIRSSLAMTLQRIGLDSLAVASAPAAREALRSEAFDLVLVDVAMPGEDGFGLARSIKRGPRSSRPPVVILSGRSSPLDLVRGALAGCDGYLVKPVMLPSLRDTLWRLLRKKAGALPAGLELSP